MPERFWASKHHPNSLLPGGRSSPKGLSVRQTEALIRRLKSEKKKPKVSRNRTEEIYLSGLAEDLSRHFGTKIVIRKDGKKGKVEIEFYSNDDLERLLRRLKKT